MEKGKWKVGRAKDLELPLKVTLYRTGKSLAKWPNGVIQREAERRITQ